MGYNITFDSGEVITFDQEPNQQDIEEAYQQISANRKPKNTIPPIEDEWSDTFEKNLLSPLLGMSRAFGGASQEAHRASMLEAGKSAEQNPTAAFAGKAAAALGPLVAGAGPLGLINPISGGVGLTSLGQMGAGVVGGAMAAPIVGPQAGMETYEGLRIKGAPEEEAKTAGWTSGLINAGANMMPLPGASLLARFAQGAGLNVGANVADKSLQNLIISDPKQRPDIIDPTSLAVSALVGGVTEGLGGNRVGDKMIDPKPTPRSLDIKKSLEEANRQYAEAKILQIERQEKELQQSIIDGTASPEMLKEAERLYQEKIQLQRSMGVKLNDPRSVHEELVREQKNLERQIMNTKHRLNTEPITDDLINLYDALSIKLEENKKALGESSYKPQHDDIMYQMTPHEIADLRIAQTSQEKVIASQYLQEARERLSVLDRNDPKNSSMIEALDKEIAAYREQLNIAPKATERPLEALKTEEVIPTPKPAEKSLSTKEIDDIMAGFNKERNTLYDNAGSHTDWDIVREIEGLKRQLAQEEAIIGLTRNDDGSYAFNKAEPKGPQYPLGHPELNKATQRQLNIYESIEERILNKLKQLEESRATGGSHDNDVELALRKQKESISEKIDNLLEFQQKSLDTDYVPKPEKSITPEQLNKFKKNVANQIINLRKRINRIENNGPVSQSGRKSINTLKDKVEKLMKDLDNIDAKYAKQQEALKPKDEALPTLDSSLIDEAVNVKPKYESIDDIIHGSEHIAQDFVDNPHLFTPSTKWSGVQVDTRLTTEFPHFQKVVDTYMTGTGLGKDKIYIVIGDNTEVKFSGNTSIIYLDTKSLGKAGDFYRKHPRLQKFLDGVSNDTFNNITLAINLGHEMGHIIFTKWLQSGKVTGEEFFKIVNGFDAWQKKNNIEPFSFINSHRPDVYAKYHSFFDEYFAERVSESLMKDHLLTAFSDKQFNIVKQITNLVNNMTSVLRTMGLKLKGEHYRPDIVNDILSKNKEEIQKTGRTIWDVWDTERNDKLILDNPKLYPFSNKTMGDIYKNPYEIYKDVPELLNQGISEQLPWTRNQQAMPNLANFSVKALDAIGSSGPWLARKMFGKTTLAQIFKNNTVIQRAHSKIRDAEYEASFMANKILFGDIQRPQWDSSGFWQKFSKIKNPDSYYMVTKNMTNVESKNIHDVFKQGFDNGTEYADTLRLFGQHLTAQEKQYFNVLAKAFKEQYDAILALERRLKKNDKIDYRPGWYPAVRQGDFFSTINVNGNTIHRQHFETKVAAEAWVKEMEGNLPNNQYTVGPVENRLDGPQHPGVTEIVDIFTDFAMNKYGQNLAPIADDLKLKMAQRGGVFGQHHLHRDNLSGYKGNELGRSVEELGHSFKQALNNNIQEFQSSYRSMKIRHDVDPILNVGTLKVDDPQAWAAINQMKDSALNVNKNNVKAFDDAVYEGVDRIAKGIYEAANPGKTFSPNEAVYKTIQNNLIGAFYLIKVLPSLSMFVTQLLSPLSALRLGAYDGGFKSMKNFGKGMYSFITKDADLMKALHEVTQTTDVIEPQFIKTLHLQGENKVLEWLKDWVGMRKPQEAADTLSRTLTFSYLFEHYKDLGNVYAVARDKALEGVDATMAAYTRGETAPMFHNFGGIIGESMRPLQTYGQMTVGNLVADMKHMVQNPTKAKAYAPFIMSGLVSTIMGGAISGAIMTQYETTRKLLMSINPQWELPSMLDLIQKGVVQVDDVVEDPDVLTKLIAYGIPSAVTGVDIGASARTTETLPGNLLTILLAAVEGDSMAYDASNAIARLFPIHNNAVQMTHGAAVLGKKAIGGNVIDSELKQAITDVSMRGPMKNALMEVTGANKTTVMGEKTNMIAQGKESKALMPEGPEEKVAHWMGNLSTEERYKTDDNLTRTFKDRVINNRVKRLYALYNENPKPKYLDELIELGVVDKNIKSQLETRAFNALVDQDIRYVTSKSGKVANTPTNARKVQSLFNFGK